ncbi:MAG: glutathione S-transferase [Pelagibacterales bacterium]|nr:glutathione S-transferase [Pelagibacterales bacterium]OUU61931.1 MAG: glutathione S-transferase [Alphaproteobacteria bacterium TMED62]|tara:strand:+ start:1626 stop:2234 length:609 start_codon:yes stop_codon:yes gene_type:complete
MLTLHYCSNSRAQRILWLLEELKLQYNLNVIKFHPSELKSDEHRKRHPLGRVPVLEEGEITIYESGAIVEYIISRHSNGELKPKVTDEYFPEYLQWFHYCEGMIMPPMNTIVVHTLILPEDRRNEEVLRQAKNLLTKALKPVNQLLEKNKYLIDKFSGVDFMLGHSLFMSNKLKCVSDEFKNIKRYLNLISEREAFQKAINT